MKIIFLCGSLEPGKDGVGDYTRRLGLEIIRQGHECAVVALNDKYVEEELIGIQTSAEIDLFVLRLPSVCSSNDRMIRAREWIDAYNPDWLSLQFVPFAFQNKGLPFGLSNQLKQLGKGRQWHIMFHELWVGMAKEDTIKLKLWGWMQKRLIKSILLKINPKVVHTQTRLYQAQLADIGFNAQFLPLFGNIPLKSSNRHLSLNKQLHLQQGQTISFVIFGTIHPDAPIGELAKEAAKFANEHKVKFLMSFVGRCGKEQEHWVLEWKSAGHEAIILGEQPVLEISELLLKADIGLATTAYPVVEKSGSVAAMREHGLPVLCVSKSWHPKGIASLELSTGITEFGQGNLEYYITNLASGFSTENNISTVATEIQKHLCHTTLRG